MDISPAHQAGMAGALINASREVAGLLGVTVIGAVLRSRQGTALRGGATPRDDFIDGYHTGLWVTIALLAVGVVLSYVSLRPRSQPRREVAMTGQAHGTRRRLCQRRSTPRRSTRAAWMVLATAD
jgi:hypothetical protein